MSRYGDSVFRLVGSAVTSRVWDNVCRIYNPEDVGFFLTVRRWEYDGIYRRVHDRIHYPVLSRTSRWVQARMRSS